MGKSIKYFISEKLLVVIGILIFSITHGQDTEIAQILSLREASNQALWAFDEELYSSFSTEDVLITTGAGTLISGKKELVKYIQESAGPRMYWIRTPDEVLVNLKTKLAWESGTWKGYVEGSDEVVVGGKYSAQWTKVSGTWLIQSQLFVTLEN
ncbi:MAG TPA: nuclear transport factor 2 family protein [Saprospiraceae bacterium]|nr:nuclear transport factor 2 family protein [Saprospiraceae bacterium]